MMTRGSRRAPTGWPRRSTPTSPGSGSTPSSASRRGVGRWQAGRGGLLLRSPVLEQAERWIAARPRGAPAPTDGDAGLVGQSRQAATRRRNILTGSLAAGLVLALASCRACLLAARHRGRAARHRRAERGAGQGGARPRHPQFQARAADRRKPGVRHRPGAARRAGHERRDRCARSSRPPRQRSSSSRPPRPTIADCNAAAR